MSKCQKDVKMSKRCQMSKSQTHKLWRRFTKKKNYIMRFTHIDVNFDVKYEDHQNCSKTLSTHILRGFGHHHVKIDINMCEPHCVNLFFYVNLLHSPCVWLFDIFLTAWHLFDSLTSFWQLDIFLTYGQQDTWAMGHMGKGVSWLILKIEMWYLGGWGTWVMGHMANGAHGQFGTWSQLP